MARSESRTKVSIWSDGDFTSLSARAQRAYWMLYSQPTITLCGVLAWTPKRWALLAADETVESVQEAIEELVETEFVFVDGVTEEVWVRSFVRHDGVARSPKTLAAARAQVGMIASATIREGVESEFSRLANGGDDDPGRTNGKAQVNTLSDGVCHRASDGVADTPPDRPRVRAHAVSVSSLQSPSPRAPDPVDDSGGITPAVTSLPARRERVEAYEADFDIAWEPYPRKIDRKAALRAYVATRRRGADPVELLKASRNYAAACRGKAPAHVKHGSTFFGPDEPWTDYVTGVPIADSPLVPVAAGGSAHPEPTW